MKPLSQDWALGVWGWGDWDCNVSLPISGAPGARSATATNIYRTPPKAGPSHLTTLHQACFPRDKTGSERLSNLLHITQQVGSLVCTRTQVCLCSPEPEAALQGLEPAGFSPPPRWDLGLVPDVWSCCGKHGFWESCFNVEKSKHDLNPTPVITGF